MHSYCMGMRHMFIRTASQLLQRARSNSGGDEPCCAHPRLVAQWAGVRIPLPELAEHPGRQVQGKHVRDSRSLQVGDQRAGA